MIELQVSEVGTRGEKLRKDACWKFYGLVSTETFQQSELSLDNLGNVDEDDYPA